jgi:BirA family biotin operon repressor/biotin-[acetyl-CoA-carboxylase] ligase
LSHRHAIAQTAGRDPAGPGEPPEAAGAGAGATSVPPEGFSHERAAPDAAVAGLSPAVLAGLLAHTDLEVEVVESTGSTNADLLRRASEAAPERPVLRAADRQTAGRGRRGRSWHGAPRGSLLFSVALRWERAPADAAGVTLACALAVARCLEQARIDVMLKWPNDILLDGRKLAGMLAEIAEDRAGRRTLVIGLGMNLWLDQHTRAAIGHAVAELAERIAPAQLRADRERWLARLAEAIVAAARAFAQQGFAPLQHEFNARLAYRGEAVAAIGGGSGANAIHGIVHGVDAQGLLHLESEQGARALASGELSLRVAGRDRPATDAP